MKKINVGLLLGGKSSEKEISLESARHVYNNLNEEKYEKILLFVDHENIIWQVGEPLLWMNTTKDIEGNLQKEGRHVFYEELKTLTDFVFLAIHGKFAEDAMPGLLEILDIPNNSAGILGGALSMDKYMQRFLLKAAGLNVPKFAAVNINEWEEDIKSPAEPDLASRDKNEKVKSKIENEIGYPCIVKPSREGSSTALSMPKNDNELVKGINDAFVFDNIVLVEEVLSGKEVTTTVVGGDKPYALFPTETPAKGNFLTAKEKFLPGDARMITPPNLDGKIIKLIQESCVKAFEVLGLKIFSRIDGFWTGEKFVILEPNNPPAMTPSTALWHQVAEANMSAKEFLSKIIDLSLEAHKNKRGPL